MAYLHRLRFVAVDLTALPFEGSPLAHTERELRPRRDRLEL